MSQLGLIDRILKATGLQECNPDHTPASQTPLGTEKDDIDIEEEWSYSSVVRMLLYLASFPVRNHLCHTSMHPFHTQPQATEMP